MRWVKGQSGNRQGRPKENVDGYNLPALCRLRAASCVDYLAHVLADPECSTRDRIKAAEVLLDRGYGRPVQSVDVAENRPVRDYTRAELEAIAFGGAKE